MDYLIRHPLLRTTDLDQSREVMGSLWDKHTVKCRGRSSFRTQVNHVQLGTLGLSYVDCATPLQIVSSPGQGHFYFQFFESGSTDYRLNGKSACGTPATAVICSPSQEVAMTTEPAKVLALQIREDQVQGTWGAAWTRNSIQATWPLTLELSGRNVAALHSAVRWVAKEFDENPSWLRSAAAVHLETSLKSLCLTCALGASRGQKLNCPPIDKVELADLELWIHANLDQPISLEILAEKYDCSIRSVQLAFRKHRDCTPMQFVRQARLWAVRRRLHEPAAHGVMISEVAFDYGFPHLGRFAQHYRETFGETPSETVAKSAKS